MNLGFVFALVRIKKFSKVIGNNLKWQFLKLLEQVINYLIIIITVYLVQICNT